MGGEWTSARISDVVNVTDYVANGSFESLRKNVKYRSEPDYAVLVRLVDHNAGWIGDFVYVDKPSFDFLRKSALAPGDIVIANVGANAGAVFRAPDLGRPMTLGPNAVLCVPKNENELHRDYLYYYLISASGQASLQSILSGSAQPKFNKTDLRRLSVPIPPFLEQRAIAHILGTLDDKIELNRRMSETLEAMARALFKSWFVDFDPVRAKMSGRDTGLPKHIADLFPDRLVDSELGEIPEGWDLKAFGDVVEHLRENENPTDLPHVLFQHFSIPAFDDGQRPRSEPGYSIKSQKLRVSSCVVLMSKLNPEIDRVWLVDVQPGDRAICSTEFVVLSPRPPYGRSYVYCIARSSGFRQVLEGLVTGTSKSHQRVQVSSILGMTVVKPSEQLAQLFERFAGSFFSRALEVRRESTTLASLRDTLIPKLISGELRVKDADKIIERVTHE